MIPELNKIRLAVDYMKVIYIIIAIIFVIVALANLFSSPDFGGMSFSEKSFVIRFIIALGLFIGGFISLAALKNWVIFAILGMAAFVVLFSSC